MQYSQADSAVSGRTLSPSCRDETRFKYACGGKIALNTLPFSRDDDCRLWRGHKELGNRWVEISVKVFQSTRSEILVKTRWRCVAFKKFIAKEFGAEAYDDANRNIQ